MMMIGRVILKGSIGLRVSSKKTITLIAPKITPDEFLVRIHGSHGGGRL
jgi:hypothetical protein